MPAALTTVGLGAAKAIPVVGNVLSGGMALNDLLHGRFIDAGLNAVGAIPGVGTGWQLAATLAQAGKSVAGNMWDKAKRAVGDSVKSVGNLAKILNPQAHQPLRAPQYNPQMLQQNIMRPQQVHPQFIQHSPGTVGSLAKLSMLKKADPVSDILTKAVQNRIANNVIDKVIAGSPTSPQSPSSTEEKAIEITSKYPEMTDLLKDERNKAYLERLMKENA